jgi:hypothetical protein
MKKSILSLALVSLAAAVTGCGAQHYQVTATDAALAAPGTYLIPPKVDILMAVDNSGSMFKSFSQIAAQMPGVLDSMESKGWDYHFATVPLINTVINRPVSEVIGSHYDSNWVDYGGWVAPYPGATPGESGTIAPFAFRMTSSYSQFLDLSDLSNDTGNAEPGFISIRDALLSKIHSPKETNFLRDDAMLVILVVGNGDDTSGVNFCNLGDGVSRYCNDGSKESSFEYYKNQFLGLKNNQAKLLKFYSAVSKTSTSTCLGGSAKLGSRYMDMATTLGGASYDVCSQGISGALEGMAGNLQAQRASFRTRYIFFDQEPNVDTITVGKYVGGDMNNEVQIPHDATNGWTYAGHITDYAIDQPALMDRRTGYAVELHGTAKLVGNDIPHIHFLPAGSVSQ